MLVNRDQAHSLNKRRNIDGKINVQVQLTWLIYIPNYKQHRPALSLMFE